MGQSKIIIEGKKNDGSFQELKIDNTGALVVTGGTGGGGGGGTVAISGDGGSTTATTTSVSSKIGLDVNVIDVTLSHTNDTVGLGNGTTLYTSESVGGKTSLHTTSAAKVTNVDELDANNLLIGEAAPGTSASASAWRIKKLVFSGGGLTTLWADGNANFDKSWTNRNSLVYS